MNSSARDLRFAGARVATTQSFERSETSPRLLKLDGAHDRGLTAVERFEDQAVARLGGRPHPPVPERHAVPAARQLDAPAHLPLPAGRFPALDDQQRLRAFGDFGRVVQTLPLRVAVAVAGGRDEPALADV